MPTMKARTRRRTSTRSSRQCRAAATTVSTANTSGTARCKPRLTCASGLGASALHARQLMPLTNSTTP